MPFYLYKTSEGKKLLVVIWFNFLILVIDIRTSSPLAGEDAFQCEQESASIRKAGAGYFN